MQAYLDLVKHVLDIGTRKENRTGVDTISTFGYYYEHDLRNGFPLLTTKTVSWKNIVVEMLWFLSGQTDISILKRHGCKFWDAWADPETGKVPSAYGNFWRQFPTHESRMVPEFTGTAPSKEFRDAAFNDQIAWVLAELRRNPMSRRMIVSAWAPGNAQTSKLPPCHMVFALNVQNEEREELIHFDPVFIHDVGTRVTRKRLCLHLTQRSCDTALGVPYNIASYALLLSIFSHLSGIEPGIFGHTLIDAHVYTSKPDGSMAEFDHVPGLKEQLTRTPRQLPRLVIDPSIKELRDIEVLMSPSVTTEEILSKFRLDGYDAHPAINFKVAV
jgi:thymidylate synthase